MNNTNLFLSSQGRKSKIQVLLRSNEGPVLDFPLLIVSSQGRGARKLCGLSSKGINLIHEVSALVT